MISWHITKQRMSITPEQDSTQTHLIFVYDEYIYLRKIQKYMATLGSPSHLKTRTLQV